jgi:NitT/TauT family transport system substrate-binding protein
MKKLGFAVIAIASLVLVVLTPQNGSAKSYLAYISQSADTSAPYWVAQDAGFFKKHGLDIELVFVSSSVMATQSLMAGDIQFTSAGGTAAVNGRLAGGDIAIINSLGNTLPYYIIDKPEIKSPEDMRGRSAAVHLPGTAADFAFRLGLKTAGLNIKDVKTVMVGGSSPRIAAVKTGQLDFTVVTGSGKVEGEKAGLKVIVDMAKMNLPFQFTCTIATGKMIRENPAEVRGLVRAMVDALHFYRTRKEDVLKIMAKYTRGMSRSALEGGYDSFNKLLVEDTYPTLEGIKNILEIQATIDPKAAKARPEEFVDVRFLDELKKIGYLDKLYGRR